MSTSMMLLLSNIQVAFNHRHHPIWEVLNGPKLEIVMTSSSGNFLPEKQDGRFFLLMIKGLATGS